MYNYRCTTFRNRSQFLELICHLRLLGITSRILQHSTNRCSSAVKGDFRENRIINRNQVNCYKTSFVWKSPRMQWQKNDPYNTVIHLTASKKHFTAIACCCNLLNHKDKNNSLIGEITRRSGPWGLGTVWVYYCRVFVLVDDDGDGAVDEDLANPPRSNVNV